MKVGAIIQARMDSKRLPGKILLPLPYNDSKPLLAWIVSALQKSTIINNIILATSSQPENNVLQDLANNYNILFFKGSEENVLSRFVEIIRMHQIETIIRITGDNPIIDINLIDTSVDLHRKGKYDYFYTIDLPLGMNIEVFDARALLVINESGDLTEQDREHVTSYFKRNKSFNILAYRFFEAPYTSRIRLTVDYPADYALLNLVAQIANAQEISGMELVQHIDHKHPWLWEINNSMRQKETFSSGEDEIRAAAAILSKYDLKHSEQILLDTLNAKVNNQG